MFHFLWEFGYPNQGTKGFILDRERSGRSPDRPVLTEAMQSVNRTSKEKSPKGK